MIVSLGRLPAGWRVLDEKGLKRILHNADMYSLYRKMYWPIGRCGRRSTSLFARRERPLPLRRYQGAEWLLPGSARRSSFALISLIFEKHAPMRRAIGWYGGGSSLPKRSTGDRSPHPHDQHDRRTRRKCSKGAVGDYFHQDELWIWIPSTEIVGRAPQGRSSTFFPLLFAGS